MIGTFSTAWIDWFGSPWAVTPYVAETLPPVLVRLGLLVM